MHHFIHDILRARVSFLHLTGYPTSLNANFESEGLLILSHECTHIRSHFHSDPNANLEDNLLIL